MPQRPSPAVRKQPQQERARVTMEAIVIAATRVLEDEGLAHLSTTRVAEIAGVSVGSLYQYFANREAILGAIIDRQLDATLDAFRGLLHALDGMAIEPMVAYVLFGLLDVARVHEKLHAPLYREMSAACRLERHARTLEAYVELVAATLAARRDVTVADPRNAAILIVHASDGVIRALVSAHASNADALIDEAVQMITRYVAPECEAARGAQRIAT